MNTNQLKKFGQEARTKLIEQVGAKLSFVLTADTALLREQAGQLKQLREELNRTTKQQLIEKVAYTWFNRLMALRFMDASDYQPLGIRVITPKDGYTLPELLDEAKRGNIPEGLRLNRQKVYDLLDNRLPSTNPQNEAYKELLIASCNHLHSTFPFLFERINDYTELLMPDDLTSDFSIVTLVRNGMLADDCKNVEIIGWLYQFYISEKKDEVFASKAKVKKEDIPAATQLFTPRWIVEYMVQNTLGKLWLQNNPKSRLRENMPYFIESASFTADDYLKVSSPEEIRLLDPASGSGHILVYGFDLFTKIYEEQGYNTTDIPKLIIEKNLYGFEIDERAAQLTGLALMMKAREYQRRAFRKDITPNVVCLQDLRLSTAEITETLRLSNLYPSDELIYDLNQMRQATNLGSLMMLHSHQTEIEQVGQKLKQFLPNADVFQSNKIEELIIVFKQLQKLNEKYHCVVTNPPYMGSGNMNSELAEFVKTNYPNSKADLMTCFMEKGYNLLLSNGFLGMINLPSWMFLSSFDKYRKVMLKVFMIESLLHLGRGIFGADFGTVTFIFRKTDNIGDKGVFRRLFEKHVQVRSVETIRNLFLSPSYGHYIANQKNFNKIPSSPIGYWLSNDLISCFSSLPALGSVFDTREGMATADNNRFLRYWFEVNNGRIGFLMSNAYDARNSGRKWFPYNKGGQFRKWTGNDFYVVNWYDDGREIKNIKDFKTERIRSHNYNGEFAYRDGITWSALSSSSFSARITDIGFLFDSKGAKGFYKTNGKYILGLLNSLVTRSFLEVLAPTIDFKVGDIIEIPFKLVNATLIESMVIECVEISKEDWHAKETSWNFDQHKMVKINGQDIEESFDLYRQYWKNKYNKLHLNEEDINRKFVEAYGIHGKLIPNVPFEEITILQDELDRKVLAKLNKIIGRNPETNEVLNYEEIELPFITQEIMAQFISYAVGCMFGRYSLDKQGVILANQGETLQDYLYKIGKSPQESSFLPDADNIIPILDNEWFEDDIVGKFYHFLKVTFGEKNFNKNVAFIEEQIGKDIRSYFIKDFFTDHIRRYKERPIYWMFSSPKGSFNALIYMHRYTPDTVSNILNKYLKEFIGKLHTRKEHLERVQNSGSPSEKTKAIKETDTIDKMLVELQEYERNVLFPMATDRITIDLDDGVLVNYNKFGKAVKEVSGLNDKQTKDKVRKFDWIDTTQIR